ncbi:MAG: hypothetical protein Q7V01_11935 [Vicinamibacterales bacterium]|nr:hypothetical protein [Vicinamibacterales bacterium]
MRVLKTVSDAAWENTGIAVGAIACSTLVHQILHEWRTPGPSSVSLWFVAGFLLVYVFWFLYGARYGRRGIWLPNAAAAVLQTVLGVVIVAKG